MSRLRKSTAEKQMKCLRLSKAIADLHEKAHDPLLAEEDGKAEAAALGITMLTNFDLIVWALRSAGGAAKP